MSSPTGKLTNLDIEYTGLLLLWLVIEDVCSVEVGNHVALFSNNSPMVHWVHRLACKWSLMTGQLIYALSLCLKMIGALPLSMLHVAEYQNDMIDIPSHLFGTPKQWHCSCDTSFLTLYSSTFPLPCQPSWTVHQVSSRLFMKVISVLRM